MYKGPSDSELFVRSFDHGYTGVIYDHPIQICPRGLPASCMTVSINMDSFRGFWGLYTAKQV